MGQCNSPESQAEPLQYKTLKLTYFNIEGAAEKLRLLFVLTGTAFEDNRISFQEFGALKDSLPTGQVPVLEIDGKQMAQSYALLRLLGRKLGGGKYYPEAKLFEIEYALGVHEDLARAWAPGMMIALRPAILGHEFAGDDDKTAKVKALREKFGEEQLEKFLKTYTDILENAGGGFFCGSEVTIADLAILPQIRYFHNGIADHVDPKIIGKFPVVTAWMERMQAIPAIAKWYESKK